MIYVGIDDTDAPGVPGTNHLARRAAAALADRWPVYGITRHQLLIDPRIPYTRHNSAACIMLLGGDGDDPAEVLRLARPTLVAGSADGSDPGVCVVGNVPGVVTAFGRRAKTDVLARAEAVGLAAQLDIPLEGLGGTGEGVTGALAAVGLAATGDDGRFVQLGAWPDDLSGARPAAALRERGVEAFLEESGGGDVEPDRVDVGKRLRPNYRGGRVVLYVRGEGDLWRAVRRT